MGRPGFVVIGTMDFTAEVSAARYARLLTREFPVLYVNPQRGPEHLLRAGQWPWRGEKLERLDERLWVYTPPTLFLLHNLSTGLNQLEQEWLGRRLRRVLGQLGLREHYLLIYQHNSAPLIERLRPVRSAYVIIDEFAAIAGSWRRRVIGTLEAELIRRADLVLVAAREVLERKRELRADLHRFPSAVETELFNPAAGAAVPVVPARIVAVSTFDERIDYDLLETVIGALPDRRFAFYGHHDDRLARLRRHPNVELHGAIPHREVPAAIAAAELCVMPYRVTVQTDAVSSLKLLEYLALGKPVLSTPIADAREHGANVTLAATAEEWVGVIRDRSWRRPEPAAVAELIARNSTARRYAQLLELLGVPREPASAPTTASGIGTINE